MTSFRATMKDEAKFIVFWISDYHSTFQTFSEQTKAEEFRDRLLKMEDEGKTYRGRSVNHVVLSSRKMEI
jgi:hypothetical protein